MFHNAILFNQDIGDWDVSASNHFVQSYNPLVDYVYDFIGTNFSYMFYGASSFNKDIGAWDVGRIKF